MKLNPAGRIVANEWEKTEKIRDRVQLGEWIVMPNHLHGIIYLKPKEVETHRMRLKIKVKNQTDAVRLYIQLKI